MNERKKKKLKKLLKEYKKHLWDNINEENNNLLKNLKQKIQELGESL